VLYTDGALSITLATEDDVAATGDAAAFFYGFFDAVIRGEYEAVNAMTTDAFAADHGLWEPFTMQQLYDIQVVKLREYTTEDRGTTVFEFDVSYCIRRNNGTFRDDIGSNAARSQIYQLYRDDYSGEVLLQSISEYNIKH